MSDCIEHAQKGNKAGYGNGHWEGEQVMLHRLAYCFNKRIPVSQIKGSVVMHTCDNPRCINPAHLRLGSQDDNMKDMQGKGRMSKGSDHYISKLTEDVVRYIRENYIPRHPEFGGRALARKFGVDPVTVCEARTGKKWKSVA